MRNFKNDNSSNRADINREYQSENIEPEDPNIQKAPRKAANKQTKLNDIHAKIDEEKQPFAASSATALDSVASYKTIEKNIFKIPKVPGKISSNAAEKLAKNPSIPLIDCLNQTFQDVQDKSVIS